MANDIITGDFSGQPVKVATTEVAGVHTPHHRDPEALALLQELVDAPTATGGATESTLAAVLSKLIGAPATEAGQAVIAGHVDGVETALAAILAKIIAAPSTAANQTTIIGHVDGIESALTTLNAKDFSTQTTLAALLAKTIALPSTEAKQDTEIAAVNRVGTRAYGTAIARLPYAGTSAVSGAVTGTEVLLHNCGTARCYVKAGSGTPVAAVSDIPIEAGEKFHLRITTGDKIAALQDSAGGNLNIIPVV